MNEEKMTIHGHLRRLPLITVPNAIYFVTTCCQGRRAILNNPEAVAILREEWESAHERHGWLVGRYVVMPDHVHFFCVALSGDVKRSLGQFVGLWKQWTSKRLSRAMLLHGPIWQAGFFDHVLRSRESYAEKWAYVRENPVRANLVEAWMDWPWQGGIDFDWPGVKL